MPGSAFTGFTRSTLRFLSQIRSHNDREWFEAHRHDYQTHLLEPFQRLVVDLAPCMEDIDPLLELRPAVGKTISRIYRDTRFSSDKSPFRNRMWITFKRPSKIWTERPAYFCRRFRCERQTARGSLGVFETKGQTDSEPAVESGRLFRAGGLTEGE